MAKTRRQKALSRTRRRSVRSLYRQFSEEAKVEHHRAMPTHEEVRQVVREARARHLAAQAGEKMDDPMLGEEAGRAIAIGANDDREAGQLWETFKAIDSSDETFNRRILGRARFPNVMKLELLPEVMETRDDDKIDVRTPEQKDIDAKRSWAGWLALCDYLHPPMSAALHMALRQRVKLHNEQHLTLAGRMFVQAIRRLDDLSRNGVDRRTGTR